eukprot:scaffold36949_cov60-Phaeocystis_antarctica.AAC.5
MQAHRRAAQLTERAVDAIRHPRQVGNRQDDASQQLVEQHGTTQCHEVASSCEGARSRSQTRQVLGSYINARTWTETSCFML